MVLFYHILGLVIIIAIVIICIKNIDPDDYIDYI